MADIRHQVSINTHPSKGELTVLFAGSAETEPQHSVGPQVLDYHLVHYVLSGKGRFRCMGKEYELGAGDSFFIFPGELAAYESDGDDPWTYRWIAMEGTDADRLLSLRSITAHRPVVKGSGRRIPLLFRRIQRTLQEGKPENDLQAEGYLRLLLAEWAKDAGISPYEPDEPESEGRRQVDQAIRWLTLQYSQPVSIDHMAQTLGYHRTYLSKIFKQQTGLSPMNFLLKIRMERARLLLEKPLTIEQVASSVGFSDALYFSKQFKKWYGASPSDYRQENQGKLRFDCL